MWSVLPALLVHHLTADQPLRQPPPPPPPPPPSLVLASGAISVRYSTTDPSAWSVDVAGSRWLRSLGGAITVARGDGTAATLLASAASPGRQTAGSDVLGDYIKVETEWHLPPADTAPLPGVVPLPGVPLLVTSIRAYSSAAAPHGRVIFAQHWPQGWNQTGPAGSASELIAAYPAFSTDPTDPTDATPVPPGPDPGLVVPPPPPPNPTLNFLSFGGCQLANTFGGRWTGAASVPDGEKLGIPLVYVPSRRLTSLTPAAVLPMPMPMPMTFAPAPDCTAKCDNKALSPPLGTFSFSLTLIGGGGRSFLLTSRLYGKGGPAVALSAATNWMTAVNQAGNHSVGLGIKRSVKTLPPGFTHETILVAGSGITDATRVRCAARPSFPPLCFVLLAWCPPATRHPPRAARRPPPAARPCELQRRAFLAGRPVTSRHL